MSIRTTKDAVAAVMLPGADYDGTSDLTPFIAAASSAVDWCRTNASSYGKTTMTTAVATLVEAWLAAGMYKMSDQQLNTSQAGRSSGSYRGQSGSTPSTWNTYMVTACMLDTSKTLAPLLDGRIAGASWLGKMPSEAIPYSERNGG